MRQALMANAIAYTTILIIIFLFDITGEITLFLLWRQMRKSIAMSGFFWYNILSVELD